MKHMEFPRLGEEYFEERLENGLLIRVVPKRGFARAHAFLAVNYGAVDTSFTLDGKSYRTPDGVAHYLEHKMFDLPEENAMNSFSALGGNPNAFTSYTVTAYYFDCTENFYDNLRLLLHMVCTPYFTEESVEKERGIIAQEIRMYEDSPDSRLYEDLFGAMFREHPARVPIAGTVESIGEITAQTLYDCHAAFYHPDNMMLCVTGDLDPETVVQIARELTGPARSSAPVRSYGAPEALTCRETFVTREMDISMPTFAMGFKCAPTEPGMPSMVREFVGDMAAEILVGESSPLYETLYQKGWIDSSFSAGYERIKDACMFTMNGDTRHHEEVQQAILDEAARLIREGIDRSYFDRLLRSSFGRKLRDLDSFENICYRMCIYHFEGVDYFRFPEVYSAASPEDILRFLEETLVPEHSASALILPVS